MSYKIQTVYYDQGSTDEFNHITESSQSSKSESESGSSDFTWTVSVAITVVSGSLVLTSSLTWGKGQRLDFEFGFNIF